MIGNPGAGKTLLFRAWGAVLQTPDGKKYFEPFSYHSCKEVADAYEENGMKGVSKWTAGSVMYDGVKPKQIHAYFDDLGAEDIVSHFGNKKEVMEGLIYDRYDRWLKFGLRTYFTTNLSMEQIRERYGERVFSRIHHMCNIIYLGAKKDSTDFRQQ